MAADVSFAGGVLEVDMDPNAPTEVSIEPYFYRNQTYVRVVGNGIDFSPRNGDLVRADLVRQIQVDGTNRRDSIDLSDVQEQHFTSLETTHINGYRRADKIIGSEVRDIIRGGRGRDFIDGQEGNDVLYGGAHDDRIYGGTGVDRIYGQRGNDKIWGNRAHAWDQEVDYVFGGAGYDSSDWDPRDRYKSIEKLF
jgi:Ca2+-binding RTX toxin-like protein